MNSYLSASRSRRRNWSDTWDASTLPASQRKSKWELQSFRKEFFDATFRLGRAAAVWSSLQVGRRRGRHFRAVHDDPRWYYRQYCHSPPAERLWSEPDERAVGAHSLHPGAGSGDAPHRLSLPTFGPETPLPDSPCRLHNRLGFMWTLRESAHVDLLPRGAGSDGCIYVATGHHLALDRIPPQRTGNRHGCARRSNPA